MLHVIPKALTYTWCTNVSDILPITCPQADSVDLNLHSPEGEVRPTSIDGKRTHGTSLVWKRGGVGVANGRVGGAPPEPLRTAARHAYTSPVNHTHPSSRAGGEAGGGGGVGG